MTITSVPTQNNKPVKMYKITHVAGETMLSDKSGITIDVPELLRNVPDAFFYDCEDASIIVDSTGQTILLSFSNYDTLLDDGGSVQPVYVICFAVNGDILHPYQVQGPAHLAIDTYLEWDNGYSWSLYNVNRVEGESN